MAVSIHAYSHFPTNLLSANLCDMDSETKIMCMLCTSSYTPNQDDHNDKADIDNEVSGTGYTAGGAALTSTAISVSGRVTTFDAADTAWSSSTITARYAVLYDDTEAAEADQPLILYVDFGEDKSSEGGTFQLTWNASGIFTITVPA
jgi:hypothetical protein